jgi:hypothetical protein
VHDNALSQVAQGCTRARERTGQQPLTINIAQNSHSHKTARRRSPPLKS